MKKILKLVLFLFFIFVIITGPSEERKKTFFDGPCSYAEPSPSPSPVPAPVKEPVVYSRIELEYEGSPQVLHVLELDLSNPDLTVLPVLAREQVFGFELLSEINKRHEADATVNAGFNFAYGQPSGLVIQNGKILSSVRGYGRILLIDGQKAWFSFPPFMVSLKAGDIMIPVDSVNPYPHEKGILVFTREYGPTNRINGKHTVCVVRDNIVESVQIASDETDIPDDGFLIVDLRLEGSPLSGLKSGERVEIVFQEQAEQGYQCSGSLVENGINVAKDADEWAGDLRIATPRTAVGIKDESTLVFLVVDGRQPGYSVGVTGKQLADILISLGVTEASMLDGGASSELIYNNEIVNRSSAGKERLLASAFIIKVSGERQDR